MFLKTWSIAIVISENDSIVFFKQTVYLWQMGVMFMTKWGIYNTAFGDSETNPNLHYVNTYLLDNVKQL